MSFPGVEEKKIFGIFTNFENADDDFDPICLKRKYWEIIKLDIIDFAQHSRIV
jgi:hypothetical protein